MEERRKYERFDLKLPAQVKLNSGQGVSEAVLNCLTRDVCAGGAYLEGVENLPEGASVSMDLVLNLERFKQVDNDKALIQVKGSVIRVEEGTGLAICFDKRYHITPL